MPSSFLARLLLVGVVVATAVGSAATISVENSGAGWFTLALPCTGCTAAEPGNNGNAFDNNYLAGYLQEVHGAFGFALPATLFRNHFDFNIPALSGPVLAASLILVNNGHVGATLDYTVYSLGAFGTYGFSDLGTGTVYGSTSITGPGTVTLSLNSAALSAIASAQLSVFSIGGIDSGELAPNGVFAQSTDFAASGNSGVHSATLTLITSSVPEPGSLPLFGIGTAILTSLWFLRRPALKRGTSPASPPSPAAS